jgi:hypothetical protein
LKVLGIFQAQEVYTSIADGGVESGVAQYPPMTTECNPEIVVLAITENRKLSESTRVFGRYCCKEDI